MFFSTWMNYFYKINWPLFILLGIYFSINTIFSIYESMRKNYKPMILLPLIYFSMHLAYGIGFIVGVFYFINKWGKNGLIDKHFDNRRFGQNYNA